jgi:hypothetical protein
VVSSTVVPRAASSGDRLPHLAPPGRVEPAPHATGEGLRRPARHLGEAELLEQLVGAPPGGRPLTWKSRPNRTRLSRAVMTSSTAVCWPTMPIRRRTSRGCRVTS